MRKILFLLISVFSSFTYAQKPESTLDLNEDLHTQLKQRDLEYNTKQQVKQGVQKLRNSAAARINSKFELDEDSFTGTAVVEVTRGLIARTPNKALEVGLNVASGYVRFNYNENIKFNLNGVSYSKQF